MPLKHIFPANLIDYIGELLNQASMGISITDPNQEDNPIIYANDYFYSMLGYSHKEIIGKNCCFLQGEVRELL